MSIAATSRVERLAGTMAPVLRMVESTAFARRGQPGVADFMLGNPHEMPLPGLVDVLRRNVEPDDPNWFAYKLNEPESREPIARSLTRLTGLEWDPSDVFMTNAGFAALAVTLRAITEPGDEVIFLSPPWFFYEFLTVAAGGEPVRVPLDPPDFDPDLDRIAAAITPRTRAIIVNSPHNPSGRIYGPELLGSLATLLADAAARIGHPIWIISDEPYNRIVFDGREYVSPSLLHPHTVVTYSYGKTLLAPGQRIGYLTVPPTLPADERAALREEVFIQQCATGYAWPNALLQHALPGLERLSIDVGALQRRRDRLVPALRDMGYQASMPEGTFYTMARAPVDDDVAFGDILARHRVLVLPGTIVEVPGWFRISLTASDEMVERGIPRFAAAMAEARSAAG